MEEGAIGEPPRPSAHPLEAVADLSGEPGFREALAALARDARIKPETRARILMFFVDHAHGHPKQPVESDWPEILHLHVDPTDVGPGRKE